MKKMLQGTALLVAVCCMVWLAVLWRWQATAHALSGRDIALYLVALPLLVFGFVLALRWAGRAAWAAAPAAGGGNAAQAGSASTPGQRPPRPQRQDARAAAGHEAAQRHATVQLLAATLHCACADSAAALLAAGAAGQPRPALDKQLLNGDGLPVMACRIAELPLDELQACLPALLPPPPADAAPPLPPAPHVLRALAALAAPLDQALLALAPWQPLLAHPQAPVTVRVLLAWPDLWSDDEGSLALAWVRQRLTTADTGAALALRIEGKAMTGVELLAEADRRLHASARQRPPELVLLAACHSELSDEAIAVLEHQRRLFSPAERPKGLIPSESAAVLVLAPAAWPAAPEAADAPPMHLHRPAIARRDKSIDAAGRVSSDVLVQSLADALAAAQRPAGEVAAVVCDADQHTARGTELFGALLHSLPTLDPAEHLCLTGTLAGQGEAGPLMAVAAAAQRARADNAPCAALSVGDSHWRLALLACPPPAPAPPTPSHPAATAA